MKITTRLIGLTVCSSSCRSSKVDMMSKILFMVTMIYILQCISKVESHSDWWNAFGDIMTTWCKMQYSHTESPTMTLKFEWRSPKVDPLEMMSCSPYSSCINLPQRLYDTSSLYVKWIKSAKGSLYHDKKMSKGDENHPQLPYFGTKPKSILHAPRPHYNYWLYQIWKKILPRNLCEKNMSKSNKKHP